MSGQFRIAIRRLPSRAPALLRLLGLILIAGANLGVVRAEETRLWITTFRVDVTPDIGDGPCVGCMPKVESIEHPLEWRGLVLRSGENTYVLSAIDFCGICNSSDDFIRAELAKAAETTPARVAVQSLHQHTAPILDADAVGILHGESSQELAEHWRFTRRIAASANEAIRTALGRLRPVTRVEATKAKVDRVASNRRVPLADGSIAVRASLTRDLAIREAPEGTIDPWLRTLSFFDGAERVAQAHYYATHPQTFYGDARVSFDCVGMARERMERTSGVFQIYFTGCGGNVTVGKYNDGSRTARDELATRVFDAMERSGAAPPDQVVEPNSLAPDEIAWDEAPIRFTVREDGPFQPDVLRRQLEPSQPFSVRLTAAMFSGFLERLRSGYVARATRLRIGPIDLIGLPGEPFVEFQLFAQERARDGSFVVVAGYGECGVWYYGPDGIYSDRGGYEQTWSVTGPRETSVKEAIGKLVAGTQNTQAPAGESSGR